MHERGETRRERRGADGPVTVIHSTFENAQKLVLRRSHGVGRGGCNQSKNRIENGMQIWTGGKEIRVEEGKGIEQIARKKTSFFFFLFFFPKLPFDFFTLLSEFLDSLNLFVCWKIRLLK